MENNPLTHWDPSGHASVDDSSLGDIGWWNVQKYKAEWYLEDSWEELKDIHSSWDTAVDYWSLGTVSQIKEYFKISQEKPMSLEQWTAAGFLLFEFLPQGKAIGIAEKGLIDSKLIRFTQDSIKGSFKNGGNVFDTINDLKNGVAKMEDFPEIRIFQYNDIFYTLDNRRLFVAQEAGVQIKYRLATQEEISKEAFKFTSINDGVSIRVRGGKN